MNGYWQEIRYALRILGRKRGFALTAIITLALGAGAATTIFSFVNSILLRPLDYPEPQRIVAVWPGKWLSKPVFKMLQEQASSFEALAGWAPRLHILKDEQGSRYLSGPRVTSGFFDVLQPNAQLGRTFAVGEDSAGSDGVVVISHRFWQSYFGGDPAALGSSLDLRGKRRRVIGIMPARLDFLMAEADLALPQDMDPSAPGYGFADLMVIGRLKKGVSLAEAEQEFRALTARARQDFGLPDNWDASARLVPFHEHLVGEVRPALLLLSGAAGLLLLIATANTASLSLARSLSRLQEFSLRLALGAGRGRLLRHLWTESALLGLLGGVAGIGLASAGVHGVLSILPSGGVFPAELPRIQEVSIDGRAAAFAILLALLAAGLAGALPAWQASRTSLRGGLASGSRSLSQAASRGRFRSAIVMAEVALVVLLLTASGLLVKSYLRLSEVDPGFRPEGLLALTVNLPQAEIASAQQAQTAFEDLQQRLSALPGVESASAGWLLPFFSDGGITGCYAAENPPRPGAEPPLLRWRPVTPGFFHTSGMSLLQGRPLSESDGSGSRPVAVLSQSAARLLFPGQNALGREVVARIEGGQRLTVAGIVADVKALGLAQDSPATIYRPFRQAPGIRDTPLSSRSFLIRNRLEPEALSQQASQAVREWNRNAIVRDLQSMPQAIAASIRKPRGTTLFVAFFTATALILGLVGVYGVMSYAVRERRRELGIRVALGANRRRVVGHVMKSGLKWVSTGTLAGLATAAACGRWIASFLFEVEPSDPWVMAAALMIAIGAALAALLVPAWSASKTDPVRALSIE